MTPLQAWKSAVRLHTLPAAVVPVVVGAGLAAGDGVFRWDAFLLTMVGAVSIQVAANFANDVSDARRGADSPDRIGPPRMVAAGFITPGQMRRAVGYAVMVAAGAGIGLAMIAGPVIFAIGLVSILAMLGYVGGPVPYGYRALGEVFVFIFFGLVATAGSRYVHDMSVPADAWLLAIPIGLVSSAILVANNYRDIETDRRADQRTLAVLLGPTRTKTLFAWLIYGAMVAIVAFGAAGWTPRATLFAGFLLPFATMPVRMLRAKSDAFALIRALKLTAMLQLWMGLVLAAGSALTL
jgi:1,4-dihydroxy-2-naphthoate octaprenyltransferase